MKNLLVFILLNYINVSFAEEQIISLNDVAKKVKESNFNILENAQRVYQAKETINFNKRNLLPKLNFWNTLKLPFGWSSAVDIIQDIAPFLVPNNWFQVAQSRLFYLAQKEQYRALWANEVMTAKLLYINTLRDQEFLKLLSIQKNQLEELINIVKTRSVLGDVAPQVLKFLQIRGFELDEDIRSLNSVIFEELKAISYLMGIPQESKLILEKIRLPNLEELTPIEFDSFIFRAIDNAPELNQYTYIKESLIYVRKEAYFSFLGSSTMSRGINGGIFNNIPVQDGLGFGLGSTIRITSSQGQIIDLNADATREVIKKNLYILVNNFNSYIENINNQEQRFKLAQDNYETVKTQILLGMIIDPLEILTSIENLFDASISLVNYKYEIVNTTEKITRSIFNGDYSKIEGKLELLLDGVIK